MAHWILAVNPGSTSTKLGLFEDDSLRSIETLRHQPGELAPVVADQLGFRSKLVTEWLDSAFSQGELSAVVGRGGMLKPIPGGTFLVNSNMLADLRQGIQGQHASNLGGLIAFALAEKRGIPAFIVDPVSVDEMMPEARVSGLPEIQRRSLSHALNIRAMARRAALDLKVDFTKNNLILVHLGGGISVSPLAGGRMVDVNNANEMGPFSPERSGGLPGGDLVDLCFTGRYSEEELRQKIVGSGGLAAYLGTNDGLEVEQRITLGHGDALLVYRALAYQVAKEIGAMATVLMGKVQAIVITGGLARSEMLIDWIKDYTCFIAPVLVYPGEDELGALARGCLRVLRGDEQVREYI